MATRTFRSGNFATDDVNDIISLWAVCDTSGYVSTFIKTNAGSSISSLPFSAGSGYQVPSGKTFIITRAAISNNGAVTYSLWYADTDVGMRSAAHGTNAKSMIGIGSASSNPLSISAAAGNVYIQNDMPLFIRVPQLKYIEMMLTGAVSGGVYLEGFEV